MKRFLPEIENKLADLLFYTPDSINLQAMFDGLILPPPVLEGDSLRINIILDGKLNAMIEKACQALLQTLIEGKTSPDLKKIQDPIKDRFLEVYRSKPEWLTLQSLEFLILFRESLYRNTLQLQKTERKLSPLERKSIRFQAGITLSRLFEAILLYQLPYHVKDMDLFCFSRLFNPLLLSGSFPEYFLSDYFCFLDIKNPVWTKERFMEYREMLIESAGYGLSSFIGLSVTSRGVALQKFYRLIRARYADFSEKNAMEIVDKVQDDPQFFKESIKHRDIRKQYLSGDIPKNISKTDFLTRLEDDFTLCAGRFPFSRFLKQSLEAEILRKIINNIVLIDRQAYPQGFDELMNEYTLFLTSPPYIHNASHDHKKKADKKPAPLPKATELEDKARDHDETIRINLDDFASLLNLKEKTREKDPDRGKIQSQNLDEETIDDGQLSLEDAIMGSSGSLANARRTNEDSQRAVISEIEQILSDTHAEAMQEEQEEPADTASEQISIENDTTPTRIASLFDALISTENPEPPESPASPRLSAVPDHYKKPCIIGFLPDGEGKSICYREKQYDDHFKLEEVIPTEASFKIVMTDQSPRFLVNKKSSWHKPTVFKKSGIDGWEATILRKSDDAIYHIYLEQPAVAPSTEAAVDNVEDSIPDVDESSNEPSSSSALDNIPIESGPGDEFEKMSSAELSQALLDGLLDFNQYNAIYEKRTRGQQTGSPLDEPDVILEQGTNWCTDWQGRISNSSDHEADIKVVLSQDSFHLDVKDDNRWRSIYQSQSITAQGFNGTFQKKVIYTDTESSGQSVKKSIVKDYNFIIMPLIGNTYGMKFL